MKEIAAQHLKISPTSQNALDNLAWAHYRLNEYEKAATYWSKYKEVEADFEDGQTVPFRHRLAMCMLKLGDTKKARELLLEDKEIQTQMLNKTRSMGAWGAKGGIHYDLAVDLALLEFEDEAIQNLDSAFKYELRWDNLFENDPAFEKIKSTPEFRKVQKKVDDYNGFMKMAFMNALNRAQASKELKGLMEK
jgi:tetratricopeptide (TPR) repeat protein